VQTANKAGVKLISLDKCVKLVMNPAYQVVPVATQSAPVRYFCRDRTGGYASDNEPTTQPVDGSPSTYLSSTTNSSGTHTSDEASSWSDTYRLHYYANSGDVQGLQAQLRAGFNPNQADRYSWTPLHYAAWYNHLDCVGALVTYGDGCDVNARTKNGSTPMHFAARTGNYNVVQLLLSHAHIDIRAKDAEGKTPLAVCESVPKEGWQACAAILRAALTQEEHPKVGST
jgi:ankyrin repeat protein